MTEQAHEKLSPIDDPDWELQLGECLGAAFVRILWRLHLEPAGSPDEIYELWAIAATACANRCLGEVLDEARYLEFLQASGTPVIGESTLSRLRSMPFLDFMTDWLPPPN